MEGVINAVRYIVGFQRNRGKSLPVLGQQLSLPWAGTPVHTMLQQAPPPERAIAEQLQSNGSPFPPPLPYSWCGAFMQLSALVMEGREMLDANHWSKGPDFAGRRCLIGSGPGMGRPGKS